ncbi:hypothetical protein Bca52824_017929 [Brassica carinata]|uniref:Uncharacterized protein n=1 Tax=Brassica carinata TaxID=52824 RepID=A0A8X7VPG2_BRACI|nr:hypothetical protein Bca52824_017929 [Brassica carinata]
MVGWIECGSAQGVRVAKGHVLPRVMSVQRVPVAEELLVPKELRMVVVKPRSREDSGLHSVELLGEHLFQVGVGGGSCHCCAVGSLSLGLLLGVAVFYVVNLGSSCLLAREWFTELVLVVTIGAHSIARYHFNRRDNFVVGRKRFIVDGSQDEYARREYERLVVERRMRCSRTILKNL